MQGEAGVGLVQLGDRLQDGERSPHRPLGVVLVRHGRSEDGHDRVADELLHRASVGLDLLSQAGVVGAQACSHVLGVSLLGGSGEPDQVAEEDGDDLSLLEGGASGRLGERRGAERAEGELARELLPT